MTFAGDERGVSAVVGFLFVFAILLLSFAGYQAVIIPDENAEVEFNHAQRVQGDMQALRTAIVGATDETRTQSVTVELGTTYPARAFAVNAAPPGGTLRTGPPRRIETNASVDLGEFCGTGKNVSTRSIHYRPSYNYYDAEPAMTYETSVTYRRFENQDGVVLDSTQALVRNRTITLRPITTSFSTSGSKTISLDVTNLPANRTVVGGPFNLTIPSGLSAETWNNELLAGQDGVAGVSPAGDARVTIEFKSGRYTLVCRAFGLNAAPDAEAPLPSATGGINPAGPGAVVLESVTYNGKSNVTLTLNNTGPIDREFAEARIPFYYEGETPNNKKQPEYGVLNGTRLNITGDFAQVTNVTIPAGTPKDVTIEFYAEGGSKAKNLDNDFFILTVRFEDNETVRYFVEIPKASKNNNTTNNS